MNDHTQPFHHILPWHISWLTVILALLAIGTFVAIASPAPQYGYPVAMLGSGMMEGSDFQAVSPPSMGVPTRDTSVSNGAGQAANSPGYYPYPSPDVPVTDTREFLKVYYNASMLTRDAQGLTRRVETTIRGYEGRIDQESSSPKYGYVGFVVPQSKYDAFRAELEGLVDSRFLSVNISSQNLLPQKQSIEEQKTQADSALSSYTAVRQKIVAAHTSAAQSLQARIDADTAQLVTLRAEASTAEVQSQIQAVTDDWSYLKQQLANENASYTSQLSNADANIKYAQDWQKAIQTQDSTFLANVATVNGTVSIKWISLWDMAQVYLPGYSIPAIFAVLAFISFLFDRRRAASLAPTPAAKA